jgi:hypothetical protein
MKKIKHGIVKSGLINAGFINNQYILYLVKPVVDLIHQVL